MRITVKLGLVVAFGACGACGGSTDQAPGGDGGTQDVRIITHPADTGAPDVAETHEAEAGPTLPFPAFLPPNPPQVVSLGGPVLKSPRIVPVFFAGDDTTFTAQIADFVSKVGGTAYWIANVSEYGAGAATGTAPIQLTETAATTIDDSAIQTWLAGKLNGNDPAWPAADENTVYALFYPTGTSITLGGGGAPPPTDGGVEGGATEGGGGGFGAETSCTDFGGYHDNITLDATHGSIYVSYAVVPRCPTFGPLTGIDVITGAGSHELIEATTDPYPTSEPAYLSVDSAHLYWSSVLGGGEVCDMCAQFPTSFTKFSELAYTVQRCWSNKAEAAGHDPCVTELPGEVYFNSAPVFSSVPATIEGMTTNVEGVTIAVGASQTLTVDLFSEGPTAGPWSLSASDLAELEGQPADLSFSFDKTSGQNGDKVQMTIKVLTAGRRNHEEFILYSKLGSQENSWIGFVNN